MRFDSRWIRSCALLLGACGDNSGGYAGRALRRAWMRRRWWTAPAIDAAMIDAGSGSGSGSSRLWQRPSGLVAARAPLACGSSATSPRRITQIFAGERSMTTRALPATPRVPRYDDGRDRELAVVGTRLGLEHRRGAGVRRVGRWQHDRVRRGSRGDARRVRSRRPRVATAARSRSSSSVVARRRDPGPRAVSGRHVDRVPRGHRGRQRHLRSVRAVVDDRDCRRRWRSAWRVGAVVGVDLAATEDARPGRRTASCSAVRR